MSNDFVHLHVHSEFSLLDGLGRVEKLVQRAQRLGQPALALTDHGTMHGVIPFFRAAKAAGIHPVVGVEAYITRWGRSMQGRDSVQDKDRHHLLLLAQNQTGYKNLLKICSDAQMQGYYYRPRIDADYLASHSEGLICTTGCLAAEVPTLLNGEKGARPQEKLALERLHWYLDVFGKDRFYIELQEHDIPSLREVNKTLLDWSRRFDVGLVVTNDVHYVEPEDARYHDVLLCVQTSALLSQTDRMRMSDGSYYLKSGLEMRDLFRPLADLPDSAFTNTVRIAEMCQVNLEDKSFHLPDTDVPEGHTYETYLRELTDEGLRWRYGGRADDADVQARKEHELKIIHQMGFDVYFLLVADLCRYARSRGIWYNVRGSGAGSIVAYAVGITGIDPLSNNLVFERFLNPGRVSMPDFDLDFPDDQREEMIRYTIAKYGAEHVAQIVSFGRMKARAAVRDVARALDIPLSDVDRIAKQIPAIPGKPVTIEQCLGKDEKKPELAVPELIDLYQGDAKVKELLDTASALEGVARHASTHAAAVIVTDQPLTEYLPVMRPQKAVITEAVTQFEFPICESIGLLKVDFLGLSTLTVMREATKLIRQRHGVEWTLDNIPLDDPESFKLLSSGEVSGVFQVEGAGLRRMLVDMQPREFNHIVAAISLYRPGPMDFIPEYVAVMHGKKAAEYVHPALEPILAETYGVCVYQEQVILLLTEIAGYTAGEADNVRRAISKKSEKTLLQHREIFAKGAAQKSGLTRQEADAIWDALLGFARYGFNRCLTGDTEILDADSGRLQRIKDLHDGAASIGRAVSCDTERLTLMPGRVSAVLDNGVKPVYRLTTGLGKQIEATANHPFFTFDGWRLLEQLRPGDRIAAPRRLPVEGRVEWPDYEVIALGHLLAEGNLCHPHSVYFYGQGEVNVADYIRAAEQFENVKCSVAMHKGTHSVYARRIDRSSEPGIVPWAKALGIWGKNARTKEVPAAAFSLTNRQLALLLGRLWSGDGHLGRRPRGAVSAYYATASERLARQVQHLLLRLGVVSRVRQQVFPYKEGRIGFQVHVMGGEQLRNFASALGPHLLCTEHQMICRWLLSEATQPDKSSRDTIPMAVKELVRAEKDAAGITWLQVNGDSGVAQREFFPAHTATKRGFRREVIGRLAEYFDSEALRIQAASDIYWDEVVSIEYVGDKRTYDLTIDDTHNFVANDLLVHNSHAADYAVVTVQTAYLKAHYPLEYMAAMLYVERDNPEKVAYYITEARRMGIEVLPPDVNASSFNFTVEQSASGAPATRDLHIGYPFSVPPGAAIRYGLAAVKNVGEGPVEAILAGRQAGPFPALEALCERVDLRKVGKKALECLIKVGALDAFGERAQLLEGIDQMVGVSRSRHEAEEAGQLSMFDLFGGGLDAGPASFAPTLTLPAVEPLGPKQRLEMEKELLGVYVSSHPLQQMAVDLTGVITCTCGELGEAHVGKPVVLAGNVVRVNQISTKKGDRMAFVTMEDLQGQCDVVVFPKTWEETKEMWVQDRIVLVRGKAEKRGESVNVLCDTVQNYVTRALAADDGDPYASLRAAPVFVDGNGHSRPPAARPAPSAAPPRSAGLRVADAAEDLSYGDDAGDAPDDGSPFALEEPEWLREAPAAWEGERGNGERLTVNGEPEVARVEPTPAAVMPRVGAPTRPTPNPSGTFASHPITQSPNPSEAVASHPITQSPSPSGTVPSHLVTQSPSHPVTVSSAPREIRITVQRTPDAERDKRLLGWVVEVLKAKPGPDRFCIIVRKNGAAVQLDFPNDTTTWTAALEQQLVRRLGVGSVEVREIGKR